VKLNEITSPEPFSQKFLPVVLKKLQSLLKQWPIATLEIQPLPPSLVKLTRVPAYVKSGIVLQATEGASDSSIDEMTDSFLRSVSNMFPKGNLLRVEPLSFHTSYGAVIILKDVVQKQAG
jgi:hypothetical protein